MTHEPGSPLELSTVSANNLDNALQPDGIQATLAQPRKSRSTLRIAAILIALSVRRSGINMNLSHQLIEKALTLHRSPRRDHCGHSCSHHLI